jgi:transcriptional antiterminator RfaH
LGISTSIIEELKILENDGVVPIICVSAFTKGENLRVMDGAFKDQVASFQMMDDKQRVQLLLNFLGRETRITVPVYAVEAA